MIGRTERRCFQEAGRKPTASGIQAEGTAYGSVRPGFLLALQSVSASRPATRFGAVCSHGFRVDDCIDSRAGFRNCVRARRSRRGCRGHHAVRNSAATGVRVSQAHRTAAGRRMDFVLKSCRSTYIDLSWPMHRRWNCSRQAAWIPRPRKRLENSSRRQSTAQSRRQSTTRSRRQ